MPVASSLGSNIVDNNLSMDNYSICNRTISQQNLAPLLHMASDIIDDGSHRVVTANNGNKFVTQAVDSLVNNFRYSALLQAGYQNQFMRLQSILDSLTKREADLISTGNSITMDIGKKITREEAEYIGLTESEYQALQIVSSDSGFFSQHTGSSDRRTSGTNVEVGAGRFFVKSVVLGWQIHNAEAYINKGLTLAFLGQLQNAIEHFDLDIKYDPKDLKAYSNKCYVLSLLKNIMKQ
ncbi:conjugal transfer protein TraG [Orientia tsutsugamushi]|uniref:Conjugal transfer protein TraG n=1 Tax=Orientia tsutsugamushi TaxID=784 RepID=A0A2U3QX55_ORITS|nr:tetratricopeptide repeat protein [Orientia tsutsugamushi]SPR05575.1 conjugal transfer protein TraG [Orientia tsutsugamushi]